MKQKYYILLFALFSFVSCKKVEINRETKVVTGDIATSNSNLSIEGTLVDIDNAGVSNYGHCWATNPTPAITDLKTEFGKAAQQNKFNSALQNLSANTVYYIRAYATDGSNVVYGETKTFNTSTSSISVSTSAAIIVNAASATIDGSITGVGSVNIIDYGHCWATTANATINDSRTSFGLLQSDKGFTSAIGNLNLETNYYVRAYAKLDNATTIYSNEVLIFIPDLKLTTDTVTVPSGNNATFQGTITSLGVYAVTDHGHCWSYLTSNPNINNNKISLGATSTTGSFFSNLTLTPGTTYYYRSYAIANGVVKYGLVKTKVY